MGVTRFRSSSVSVVEMTDLSDHQSNQKLLHDGIGSIVQGGPDLESGPDLVSGINGGTAQFGSGLVDRSGASNVMILITDGEDTHGITSNDLEKAVLGSGSEVFTVGVGGVPPETLDAIASHPDSTYRLFIESFSGLSTVVATLFSMLLNEEKI